MIIKTTLYFLLWLLVWSMLSWPPAVSHLALGALVSAFVVFMTNDFFGNAAGKSLRPGRVLWFLWYAGVFSWECLKANVDVAYRVLHPRMPIRPGTVRVPIELRSDVGLTFLANSVTLTPGTTTIDIDKEKGYIYVHWICVKEGRSIVPVVRKFERILKRIFD